MIFAYENLYKPKYKIGDVVISNLEESIKYRIASINIRGTFKNPIFRYNIVTLKDASLCDYWVDEEDIIKYKEN